MNPALSQFLNMARWMAAWVVLISHVRHLLLVDYALVSSPSPLVKAFYIMSGFGHEAVMMFFVISGYLVGGISLARWQREGLDVRAYFCHRVSRIYTVLLPALLVGWGLDLLASHYFNASGLYTEGGRFAIASVKSQIASNLDVITFLGNLLMLDEGYVSALGTNGVVWSLAYEWWYYCVFVAAAGVWFGRGMTRGVSFALLLCMLVWLPPYLLLMGLLWLLGVAVFFYGRAELSLPSIWFAAGVFLAVLGCVRMGVFSEAFVSDAFVAAGFALLLCASHGATYVRFFMLHEVLASFSYSLYLVHVPLLFALAALLHDRFGVSFQRQPDMFGLGYCVVMFVVCVVFAWGFSNFTERHTSRVRRWLSSVFCAS